MLYYLPIELYYKMQLIICLYGLSHLSSQYNTNVHTAWTKISRAIIIYLYDLIKICKLKICQLPQLLL